MSYDKKLKRKVLLLLLAMDLMAFTTRSLPSGISVVVVVAAGVVELCSSSRLRASNRASNLRKAGHESSPSEQVVFLWPMRTDHVSAAYSSPAFFVYDDMKSPSPVFLSRAASIG